MRLVLWSDVQTHFSNIAECQIATRELLATAKRLKPDVIIHAGDAKDEYSPISQSVIKEVVRQTKQIVGAGFRYIVLKGNHDRESQSPEAEDWLSVLRAAGAEIVTKPRTLSIDGMAVAFLPFMADKNRLIEAAKGLSGDVLIFHNEVLGSTPGKGGISLEDLGTERYMACFGGHIHNHQQLSWNTWYIGSPFTHDWSEANFNKGHLFVDVGIDESTGGKWCDVEQQITKIPHWYDVSFLAQNHLRPEPGAYVRSKIVVSTKKISDQLDTEEKRILKKYPNVRVHTVPELEKVVSDDLVLSGHSDKERVAQYVMARMPDTARFEAAQAVTYMAAQLEGMKEHRAVESIRFEFARFSNTLVFPGKVGLRLARRGLVLVKGKNHDVRKRSNGSGKTSLLSAIAPIPMFGETLKKQKSDEWACERTTDTAETYLRLTDHAGRKVEIIRTRRPHALRLKIDGKDKSSGLRGTGKKLGDTQGRIERVTGFDLHTFTSAVYIDQSIANGFVFGQPSFRLALMSRLLNLDRYEAALQLVGKDIKKTAEKMIEVQGIVESQETWVTHHEEQLQELRKVRKETQWTMKYLMSKTELDGLIDRHAALALAKRTYDEMQEDIDDQVRDQDDLMNKLARSAASLGSSRHTLEKAEALVRAKKCPTCGQSALKVGQEMVRNEQERIVALQDTHRDLQAQMAKLTQRIETMEKKVDHYNDDVLDVEAAIKRLRSALVDIEDAQAKEDQRNAVNKEDRRTALSSLRIAQRVLKAARERYTALAVDREMLEFAKKAFHRSGMPIYLSMALCPVLNSAAEEYSNVFTDGKLKVSFKVENGEFDVDVINPTGSQTVKGQSVGEAAMAGIIAAFALREPAPKTNLLVLDEPGHGLDQEGARQFAEGLLKLKDRFETILLVTHSPAIESVLAGEHLWMVEKSGGKSSLTIVN